MNTQKLKNLQRLLDKIPKGKVTTYKEIARAMGIKGCRYVGQLLNKNPEPDKYPCYKVVRSNGKSGGYSGGQKNKYNVYKMMELKLKKVRC